MRRIQQAILCPFMITGWGVMSFTFIFLSLGVSKIFEASKLVLTGNFSMETAGVKGQEVFIRICCSFIRALYRILDCGWEDILKGLIITTSSDPSKCSYHILYAPVLLIDHCELKAFAKLVYTLTGEKFGKYID